MSRAVLPRDLAGENTLAHARFLLGKYLVRKIGGRTICAMITEVEAYDGPEDKASHARRGKTERNAPMFGPAGRWYVYLVYGMHHMVNIVTGQAGYPAAVLIRGVEGVGGPGRVARYFHVDRRLSGKSASPSSGFYVLDRGKTFSPRSIAHAPRIGVRYAGSHWAAKPYRLYVMPERPPNA